MKMQILTIIATFMVIFMSYVATDEEKPPSTVAKPEDEDDSFDVTPPEEEKGVLVLTSENFDSVIYRKDIVLVEFYAPWCGHCKSLAPQYEKAAAQLKELQSRVILGKVDATIETELATKFGVTGYPTLKYFIDGKPFDYEGGRDADGIVEYMQARADPSWSPPPEAVVVLTKDNFTEFTEREELSIVMFYAPWCGHCKRLHPEYEKAAQELKKQHRTEPLAKVDATVEPDLATKYGVTGYPTLKMFRKGRVYDFKGETRDSWGMLSYIDTQRGMASKEFSSLDAIKKYLGSSSSPLSASDGTAVTSIAFFSSADDAAFGTYNETTNHLRDDYKFYHTFDEEARNFYKLGPGSVAVFLSERFQTKYEPKMHSLEIKEETSASDLIDFIKANDAPLVGEYNSETSAKTYKTRRPLVLFFMRVDWSFAHRDATQAWRKKFAYVAQLFPSLKFAIIDEEQNRELVAEFGLDESSEEINVGIIDERDKKYAMKPQEEYESDEVISYLKDYLKGNLVARVKSQPVPKKQEGPVTIVVGKTFEKIVLDKKKDVLIELYAPSCGHCRKLEPIYKDLAKKFKKEKNLVIAKMDASANDVPDNYPSNEYPKIYFAPANNKDSPIAYTGDRKLDDLVKFVKQHASVALRKSKKDEL